MNKRGWQPRQGHDAMMDYEFSIQLLQKEAAHLKEMQDIARQRQDLTDQRLERIQDLLIQAATNIRDLTAAQATTDRNLKDLIEALLHRPTNGHGKSPEAL